MAIAPVRRMGCASFVKGPLWDCLRLQDFTSPIMTLDPGRATEEFLTFVSGAAASGRAI
jgi:hypothetical protein